MAAGRDVRHMRRRIPVGTMTDMTTALLALHIAAGSVALASMFVPMFTHKGGRAHRRSGWVFVAAMAIVSATAFALSGARLLFDRTPDGRDAGLFLFYVSILTASSVSAGMRVLRFKNRSGAHLHWWDTGLPLVLAASSIGMAVYGLRQREVLFIVFSIIGGLNAAASLRYWLRTPTSRAHWWFEHMGNMLGGCIATTTAFLVNTADNFGIWPLAAWLAPSIVGGPAIAMWSGYYRRKFSGIRRETHMPALKAILREMASLVVLSAVIFGPGVAASLAQAPQRPPQQALPDFPALLKSTPGVLGVETAQTSGGKQPVEQTR